MLTRVVCVRIYLCLKWRNDLLVSIYSMVCLNTGFWLVGRFNAQVVPSQFNHSSMLMHCFNWCTLTNTHHSLAHTHTHTHMERERERADVLHTYINFQHFPAIFLIRKKIDTWSLHYIPQQPGDKIVGFEVICCRERHADAASTRISLSLSLSLSLDPIDN